MLNRAFMVTAVKDPLPPSDWKDFGMEGFLSMEGFRFSNRESCLLFQLSNMYQGIKNKVIAFQVKKDRYF